MGEAKSKLCFVVSPIGAENSPERIHADWLLEIIKPVMVEFNYTVKRADHDPRPGNIDAQVINDLETAELVIADLSFVNPNVFYEIGIRHVRQLPIIHMQLATEKVPFDVSLYRAIKFSRERPQDLDAARGELKRQVQAVLADGYVVENPVTKARGYKNFPAHATDEQKLLMGQMQAMQEQMRLMQDQIQLM